MSRIKLQLVITFIFLFHNTQLLYSQSLNLPSKGFTNTFGVAISSGVFLDKDAVFVGFSIDYAKVLKQKWIIDFAFAYDKEFSNNTDNTETIVNTLTPSLALGYAFNQKVAMGIGIGKGLFDDDNNVKKIEFNKNGGWTMAIIGVYSFYQYEHHSFDVSAGIERGLTSPETDVTLELGYGFSF